MRGVERPEKHSKMLRSPLRSTTSPFRSESSRQQTGLPTGEQLIRLSAGSGQSVEARQAASLPSLLGRPKRSGPARGKWHGTGSFDGRQRFATASNGPSA